MNRYSFLFAIPFVVASCKSEKDKPIPAARTEVIEVLQHLDGDFTTVQRVPVGEIGSTFLAGDVEFTLAHFWQHAETTRSVTDDAESSNHGVEVTWPIDGEDHSHWIFQTDSNETMSPIEALGAVVRVTPPGARPPGKDESDFSGQVQIRWGGKLLDLPEIGGEVFEGWTLKGSKSYQHALMNDEGGVTEAEDASFSNRVFEVHLSDGDGTEERHLAFLDHPEITRGIHPTILPVTRLSGSGASQSRLSVCTPVPLAAEQHMLQISPHVEGEGLTVHVWLVGEPDFKSIEVDQLPGEIPLGEGQTLGLAKHFSRARSLVKWEQADEPKEGDARPALLIEHHPSHYEKNDFVLILDEVTPCRIGRKHLMLRYTTMGK